MNHKFCSICGTQIKLLVLRNEERIRYNTETGEIIYNDIRVYACPKEKWSGLNYHDGWGFNNYYDQKASVEF